MGCLHQGYASWWPSFGIAFPRRHSPGTGLRSKSRAFANLQTAQIPISAFQLSAFQSGQRLAATRNQDSCVLDLPFQISCDFGELGEGGFEVFGYFKGDDTRVGEVGAVFQAFVFEPENVEVDLVALD